MHSQQLGPTNGASPSSGRSVAAASELDLLRATCRRQAHVIDTLSGVVSTLRGGAAALKAENADLRATYSRGGVNRARTGARRPGHVDAGATLDVTLPLDIRAPGAARIVVAALLHDRVPASVLRDAQLVASELVSNSLRHSCPRASVVFVRAQLTGTMVRLEVADGGRDGVIAPRPPDLQGGGGMGLNVVQALSERWGLERVPASGSRVWAQLPRTPRTASAAAQASGDELAARAARNGGRTSGRGAPRRRSAEGTP